MTLASARSEGPRPIRLWRWVVALVICATLFYGIAGYLCTASDIGDSPEVSRRSKIRIF